MKLPDGMHPRQGRQEMKPRSRRHSGNLSKVEQCNFCQTHHNRAALRTIPFPLTVSLNAIVIWSLLPVFLFQPRQLLNPVTKW